MRVASIGAGSWGTSVAALAASNGIDVLLWARRAEVAEEINRYHTNGTYLPGIALPENLRATDDIEQCVTGRDVVVMGVPSHGWREILRQAKPYLGSADALVSLTKGLEGDRCLRMSEVVAEELPEFPSERYGILTGPNIAREVAKRLPAAAVIAFSDEARATAVQDVFHQPYFRVYSNTDVAGCELAGAIKNIVAIAAGIADEFGFGDNAMAALMTRGLAELTRLGVRLGGRPMTFAGLAGIGDLIVTCVSKYSRNRRVGKEIGKGRHIDDVVSEMQMVAEGVKTCRPILELGGRCGAWMPITESVVSVIYGGVTPDAMVEGLLSRPPMSETFGFDP